MNVEFSGVKKKTTLVLSRPRSMNIRFILSYNIIHVYHLYSSSGNFYRSTTRLTTFGNFIDHFDARAVGLVTRNMINGTLYHPAVTGTLRHFRLLLLPQCREFNYEKKMIFHKPKLLKLLIKLSANLIFFIQI